jgi:hypothetical protein
MFRNYEEVILKRFGFNLRGNSSTRVGLGAAPNPPDVVVNNRSRAATEGAAQRQRAGEPTEAARRLIRCAGWDQPPIERGRINAQTQAAASWMRVACSRSMAALAA